MNYLKKMHDTFSNSYQRNRDMWSKDDGLRVSAYLLGVNVSPNSLILDIGAGCGADTSYFLEKSHRVHAIDIVKNESWEKIKNQYNKQVEFYQTNFQEYKTTLTYDGILDNGCFHHQQSDELMLYIKKVYQMLKPRGLFCLNVYSAPFNEKGKTLQMKDGRWAHTYSIQELTEYIEQYGFLSISVRKVRSSQHSGSYLLGLFEKE